MYRIDDLLVSLDTRGPYLVSCGQKAVELSKKRLAAAGKEKRRNYRKEVVISTEEWEKNTLLLPEVEREELARLYLSSSICDRSGWWVRAILSYHGSRQNITPGENRPHQLIVVGVSENIVFTWLGQR